MRFRIDRYVSTGRSGGQWTYSNGFNLRIRREKTAACMVADQPNLETKSSVHRRNGGFQPAARHPRFRHGILKLKPLDLTPASITVFNSLGAETPSWFASRHSKRLGHSRIGLGSASEGGAMYCGSATAASEPPRRSLSVGGRGRSFQAVAQRLMHSSQRQQPARRRRDR